MHVCVQGRPRCTRLHEDDGGMVTAELLALAFLTGVSSRAQCARYSDKQENVAAVGGLTGSAG